MFHNRKTRRNWIIATAAWTVSLMGAAWAAPQEKPKEAGPPLDADVYPLDTCVVTGQKLGSMGDPVVYDYKGREIRFCCKACIQKLESDPAAYLKEIDAAIVKQQRPYYPLDTCLISGEKLGGEMGKPVEYVHNNRLVRFCCAGCVETFGKDPVKHLAKLNKAVIEKQEADYPLDTCVVMGTRLGKMGETIRLVSGNRLIKFCCKSCAEAFKKEPAKYLDKLDKAWKAKKMPGHQEGPAVEHKPMGGAAHKH